VRSRRNIEAIGANTPRAISGRDRPRVPHRTAAARRRPRGTGLRLTEYLAYDSVKTLKKKKLIPAK
jgi:hypothetical protein